MKPTGSPPGVSRPCQWPGFSKRIRKNVCVRGGDLDLRNRGDPPALMKRGESAGGRTPSVVSAMLRSPGPHIGMLLSSGRSPDRRRCDRGGRASPAAGRPCQAPWRSLYFAGVSGLKTQQPRVGDDHLATGGGDPERRLPEPEHFSLRQIGPRVPRAGVVSAQGLAARPGLQSDQHPALPCSSQPRWPGLESCATCACLFSGCQSAFTPAAFTTGAQRSIRR